MRIISKKLKSVWLATYCLILFFFFPACSLLPGIASKYTTPYPASTQTTVNEIYPPPQDCKKIDSSGLPVGTELRNSHIIYLAGKDTDNLNQIWSFEIEIIYLAGKDTDNLNQIWSFEIESGLQKMILETTAYRFGAIGFLKDKYHFVMAGNEKFWLSDIAGLPPKLMELTSPELASIISNNFSPYSRIAREYNGLSSNESPDGLYKAVWNLGAPNLVITNNRTGENVNVIQYDGHGYIAGNWSPDGKYYAFSYSKEQSKVYIVNADGSNLRELATLQFAGVGRPYWSPNGEIIVYTVIKGFQFRPTYYQILTIATGDTKTYGINAEESLAWRNGNDIVWSPDSEWVLFYGRETNANQQDNIDIKVLNISTGDFYCITDDSLIEIMADWR